MQTSFRSKFVHDEMPNYSGLEIKEQLSQNPTPKKVLPPYVEINTLYICFRIYVCTHIYTKCIGKLVASIHN